MSIEEGDAKAREFSVMFIETSAKAGFNIKVCHHKSFCLRDASEGFEADMGVWLCIYSEVLTIAGVSRHYSGKLRPPSREWSHCQTQKEKIQWKWILLLQAREGIREQLVHVNVDRGLVWVPPRVSIVEAWLYYSWMSLELAWISCTLLKWHSLHCDNKAFSIISQKGCLWFRHAALC